MRKNLFSAALGEEILRYALNDKCNDFTGKRQIVICTLPLRTLSICILPIRILIMPYFKLIRENLCYLW